MDHSGRTPQKSEAVSPFLQGLLRFSPKSAASPRFFDNASVTTTIKQQQQQLPDTKSHDGIPIEHLRRLATESLLVAPGQACSFASLLYAKTGQPRDALTLAQAHLQSDNTTACLRILEDCNLLHTSWEALSVAVIALAKAELWSALAEVAEEACKLDTTIEDDDDRAWQLLRQRIDRKDAIVHPLARILYWRAHAYHELGNSNRAVVFWKRAILTDCQCQEAWDALLRRQLLSPTQAYELLQRIHFPDDMQWLKCLYMARIELSPQEVAASREEPLAATTPAASLSFGGVDASSIGFSSPLPTVVSPGMPKEQSDGIQNDVDRAFTMLLDDYKLHQAPQVLAMAARRAYRSYQWKQALEFCQELAACDPTLSDAAYCYVATLVILGHKRTLFRLAHDWMEANPKSGRAWFAVGSYYYCCQRYHVAQRHYCRATRLDPSCTEAWIAFGCAFAACDESDQALASFRAAQRLSPGEHASLLYMGMEYARTNHLVLAQHFLQAALTASGGDPLCLHELGVMYLKKGDCEQAIHWLTRALAAVVGCETLEENLEHCQDPYWEPTVFNLGHALRKRSKWELAAKCYVRCTGLRPDKFSAYSALGMAKHYLEELDGAIECYHQALSLKSDDPFSTEMLNRALRESLPTKSQASEFAIFKTVDPIPISARKTGSSSLLSEDMEMDTSL